jgi:hypothetical protein
MFVCELVSDNRFIIEHVYAPFFYTKWRGTMRKTPKHQQTMGYLRIKHGELSIRNDK